MSSFRIDTYVYYLQHILLRRVKYIKVLRILCFLLYIYIHNNIKLWLYIFSECWIRISRLFSSFPFVSKMVAFQILHTAYWIMSQSRRTLNATEMIIIVIIESILYIHNMSILEIRFYVLTSFLSGSTDGGRSSIGPLSMYIEYLL